MSGVPTSLVTHVECASRLTTQEATDALGSFIWTELSGNRTVFGNRSDRSIAEYSPKPRLSSNTSSVPSTHSLVVTKIQGDRFDHSGASPALSTATFAGFGMPVSIPLFIQQRKYSGPRAISHLGPDSDVSTSPSIKSVRRLATE